MKYHLLNRLHVMVIAALMMAAHPCLPAQAQPISQQPRAYHFPAGSIGPLVVHQGYAYVLNGWTRGDGILVMDVRDADAPGFVDALPAKGYLAGAVLHEQHLYIPTAFSMMVVSVADPARPRLVRNMLLGFPRGQANMVAVVNQQLYLAGRDGALRVFDVREPDSPVLIGMYENLGPIAQLAPTDQGLLVRPRRGEAVLLAQDADDLTERARLVLRGTVQAVGQTLYETTRQGLVIHDLSDLSNITVAGQFSGYHPIGSVQDHRLLVEAKDPSEESPDRWLLLDVSQPLEPRVLEQWAMPENVQPASAVLLGRQVYLLDSDRQSLRIFELGDQHVTARGELPAMRNAGHMAADSGSHLWLSYGHQQAGHLLRLNLDQPGRRDFSHLLIQSPQVGYRMFDVHRASAIAHLGDYLLTSDGLVDVRDPEHPRVIRGATRAAAAMAVVDGVAYLAQADRLTLLDVSRLPDLLELAVYQSSGQPHHLIGVAAAAGRAYLLHHAPGESRLEILDVSNPAMPTLLGTCAVPDAITLAVRDDLVYLPGTGRGEKTGMAVVDVSNPQHPQLIHLLEDLVQSTSYRIAVHGDHLYYTEHQAGIKVAELQSDPRRPRLVRVYRGQMDTLLAYTDFAIVDHQLVGLRFSQVDVWDLED